MIHRRYLVIGLGVGVTIVVLGLGVGLVAERGAVSARLATEYLRRHGVPATIHIDVLNWRGMSGSAVLGRPDQPDLTVDHFEVQFAKSTHTGASVAFPKLASIVLVRPHLKARLHDGRLTIGTLQPLIDDALRQPAGGGGTTPDITIRDGRLDLSSDAGRAVVGVDGSMQRGRLVTADLRLAPADLASSQYRAGKAAGELSLRSASGDRLKIRLHLAAATLQSDAIRLVGTDYLLVAEAPYARQAPLSLNGPISGRATVRFDDLTAARAHIQAGAGGADFNGAIQSTPSGLSFVGPVALNILAGAAVVDGQQVAHPHIVLHSPSLTLSRMDKVLKVDGPYQVTVATDQGRVGVGGQTVALSDFKGGGQGRLHMAGEHAAVQFRGHAGLAAALPARDAQRLAVIATGAGDPVRLRDIVARNLRSVRISAPDFSLSSDDEAFALDLHNPISAIFAAGAQVKLGADSGQSSISVKQGQATGALSANLTGPGLPSVELRSSNYSVGKDAQGLALNAIGSVSATGDVGPAHGAKLRASLAVARHQGRAEVTLSNCADLSLAAYQQGAAAVASAVSANICPTASPLLTLQQSSWTVSAKLRAVGGALTAGQIKLDNGEGQVQASGGRGAPSANLRLDNLVLRDTLAETRFHPIQAVGSIELRDPRLHGRFNVSLVAPASSIGVLTLDDDLRGNVGQATLAAPGLVFAAKGLQPATIAPALGKLASAVDGPVDLEARVNWSQGKLVSGAEMSTRSLALRSPAGQVSGLRGTVHFNSLAPLTTPPDQILTADRLDAFLPVTGLSARFGLGAATLSIQSASATVAKGKVSLGPTTVPITPGAIASISDTVTVTGLDLQDVIAGLNLSKAVSIQARLDGVLPITFGPQGVRIAGGRLVAEGPGRLTVRREALTGAVATGGAAGAQPNAVQDFAYQALENLAFDSLDASIASRPQGRLGIVLHVKGRHDPPTNPPSRINLWALLRGHAFDKPIPLPKSTPVDLTLDTSLNLDELLADYAGLNRLDHTGGHSPPVQPHPSP